MAQKKAAKKVAKKKGKTLPTAPRKRQSQAWKALERMAAGLLRGTRVLRGADFSRDDVDVRVPDMPFLKVDAKLRQSWAHHAYVKEVARKYCVTGNDVAVLVTREAGKPAVNVTVSLVFFAYLLDMVRAVHAHTGTSPPFQYDATMLQLKAMELEDDAGPDDSVAGVVHV